MILAPNFFFEKKISYFHVSRHLVHKIKKIWMPQKFLGQTPKNTLSFFWKKGGTHHFLVDVSDKDWIFFKVFFCSQGLERSKYLGYFEKNSPGLETSKYFVIFWTKNFGQNTSKYLVVFSKKGGTHQFYVDVLDKVRENFNFFLLVLKHQNTSLFFEQKILGKTPQNT